MDLYQEIQKYEDLVVQSNIGGFYTKRVRLGEIEHNHRKIAISEIVIDIDTHARKISHTIADAISSRLIKDSLSHTIWDTSRSPHFHLFFKDLHQYPKDMRKKIRKLFLTHYCRDYLDYIDFGKCSEDVMIRDFYALHEKTHQRKLCIFEFKKHLNTIPKHIVDKVCKDTSITTNSPRIESKGVLEAFLNHCMNNRFDKNGGRNQVLFKNVAIACYLLGYDKQLAKPIFNKIAVNSHKTPFGLMGWFEWCNRKKNVEVGWNELKKGGFYDNQ